MRGRKWFGRKGIATLAGCLALLASALSPAVGAGRATHSHRIDANLSLKDIRVDSGPEEVRILILDPANDVPDIATATHQYPMWGLTSTMSSNHGAIAGVNGDFGTGKGQPVHTLMIDGEVWTTGQSSGNAVGWSADGKRAYIGHPALKTTAVDVTTPGTAFNIPEWNVGAPRLGDIGAFTARGGSITKPPGKVTPQSTDPKYCAARLVPSSPIHWNSPKKTSLVRTYTVEAQPEPCERTPLGLGGVNGAVVVASKFSTSQPNKILGLKPNDSVKLSITFQGWPGVTDVMGGSQMLVDTGRNVAPDYTAGSDYILNYNPRTAVGITKGCSDADPTTNCKLILVTIDGRQAGWSQGSRMPFLAAELLRVNAWMALNLDGGGSTTMWVKNKDAAYCQSSPNVGGCLVQRPSSANGERATRSAIVVLPSADSGTPPGLK